MNIDIYTKAGQVRHTTNTTAKNSERGGTLMSENYVKLAFKHTRDLKFKSGDYIVYKGVKFTILNDYKPVKNNDNDYSYELKFEGIEALTKLLPFFHYVTVDSKTEKEPEFNYTATIDMFGELIITALRNTTGDTSWTLGECSGTGTESTTFSAVTIFDAMGIIADLFKTEWWFEGKKLNLSRCERGDLQTFSAQHGGGLQKVDIPTSSEPVPNRIYPYGSTRNITKKYNAEGIAYNTRLHPSGSDYVDVTGGAENIVEKIVFFDNDEIGNIYPQRIGTISQVEVGGSAEAPVYYFYDDFFLDPEDPLYFDPKEQLIEGTTMMVHFESGMLMGRDFELGYNDTLKRFEIINTQEGDIQVPFGSIIPQVGDYYVLWNIEMPESYIINAEHELRMAAQDYVDNLNKKVPTISCQSDPVYFNEYGKVIDIGSRIKINDDRLKGGYVKSRVTKYSYPLYCESLVDFTLAENVSSGRLTQIENKIEDVTADNSDNVQKIIAVSRRGWRDAKELSSALESLQSEVALVGNPESQFGCTCIFKTNKNNDPNLLAISSGELQHVVYMGASDGKWTIEGGEFTLTANTLYYIYFKCSKTVNTGNVIISTIRLGLESQEGYYLFLGATVSSIFENARIVNVVSGFTQIAGGNITTESIQDPNSRLVINLSANPPTIMARYGAKIIGDFVFESASGLDNIDGISDIKYDISNLTQVSKEVASKLEILNDTILPDMQDQIDGSITSYEGTDVPMLTNYPASSWTTEEERQRHINDYYDRFVVVDGEKTVERYKFTKLITGYEWIRVADTGAALALSEAREALGMAGTKARLFYGDTLPTPPYSVNDGWIKQTGEIYICNAEKGAGGIASQNDWMLVNDAQFRLRQMSADDVISKEEKVVLRNTVAQIRKAYAQYAEDATTYDVSITDLKNAYETLINYLVDVIQVDSDTDKTLTAAEHADYNTYFANYNAEVLRFANAIADKIAQNKVADFEYLKDTFAKDQTIISGGVVLSRFMGVTDGNTSTSAVVAGMNGSEDIGYSAEHGKLMLFAGAANIQNVSSAKTRIYGDGTIDTAQIIATGGVIGGFEISSSSLTSSRITSGEKSEMILSADLIKFTGATKKSTYPYDYVTNTNLFIGGNVLPATMGGSYIAPMRVEVDRAFSGLEANGNIGIYISVMGANPHSSVLQGGNLALYIASGTICGLRLYNRNISSNVTLGDMDCFVAVDSDGGRRTITLPSNPQDGQLYYIRNMGSKGVTLQGNGNQIALHTQGAWVSSDSWTDRERRSLVYSKSAGCWILSR